ncbi:hypothetical protein RGU70_02890 [Herbaspirillum sp. RTI4]|uniref:hypothetical protein n=1 Tax=Herbaspirillum sp. RTI4 TaxID=3048640 RepID=UPI002AB391F6|nr:hypothetical protein [Herbaspirillum sp. RTI4]MDY7577276.1 hypothetical protein [Herbaspirillum sp. RTI4]MEA9983540.1 hypothetical protein [Herbaspirillum sp. RTI4]
MWKAQAFPPKSTDLQQHFQNYFELLLNTERTRLELIITREESSSPESVMSEIERRIDYLKGAVRMGRLLCLINSDEAKLKHQILMSERESLLAHCAACCSARESA